MVILILQCGVWIHYGGSVISEATALLVRLQPDPFLRGFVYILPGSQGTGLTMLTGSIVRRTSATAL